MFEIRTEHQFDAAHRLENYSGPCARMHGHTFTVIGKWRKDSQDRAGITLDLVVLKRLLRGVTADMDHYYLNKIRALGEPTAENLARLLFERLAKKDPSGKYLHSVTVVETPGSSVTYTPSPKGVAKPKTESEDVPHDQ